LSNFRDFPLGGVSGYFDKKWMWHEYKFKITILIVFSITVHGYTADFMFTKKGDNNMSSEIWQAYINYWTNKDKSLKINLGEDTQKIEEYENRIDIKLPDELKKSLLNQYHYSRRGDDGLRYSWFGDLVEINFLSLKKMQEEYQNCLKEDLTSEINTAEEVQNIYIGDIAPYKEKGWSKFWIPILVRYDVELIIFLDLRPDINQEQYGSVLVIMPLTEENGDDWHTRIAYVAGSFNTFMKEALEYMSLYGGLDNKGIGAR